MTKDPTQPACPGCGASTVAADIGLPPSLRPARSEDAVVHFAGVPLKVRVCPRCGRVDFFARDLKDFRAP